MDLQEQRAGAMCLREQHSIHGTEQVPKSWNRRGLGRARVSKEADISLWRQRQSHTIFVYALAGCWAFGFYCLDLKLSATCLIPCEKFCSWANISFRSSKICIRAACSLGGRISSSSDTLREENWYFHELWERKSQT